MHRCGAWIKIVLLAAFSVALFFVAEWWVMALFVTAIVAGAVMARIPLRMMVTPLVPVIVLALFAVAFAVANSPTPAGLSDGLLVAVRMIALVSASFVVCLTTRADELLKGFAFIIGPLRVLHVPVGEIAFTLALALRFIPTIAEELLLVRMAQKARGADASGKGFWRELQIWGAAFTAVFVGLFRRADALADAMDARCFGARAR